MANLGNGLIIEPIVQDLIYSTIQAVGISGSMVVMDSMEKISITVNTLGDLSQVPISQSLISDNLQWGTSLWLMRD